MLVEDLAGVVEERGRRWAIAAKSELTRIISRSVTDSSYRVADKQVVSCPLGSNMFWQVDYHALRCAQGRATPATDPGAETRG